MVQRKENRVGVWADTVSGKVCVVRSVCRDVHRHPYQVAPTITNYMPTSYHLPGSLAIFLVHKINIIFLYIQK